MTERARKVEPGRLRVIAGGSPTPAPSYRLLTQVSAALSTSLDLDRTLKEILERMNALVAFDAATIFLLDDARRELHVKAALGVPVALKEVKSFQVGEGVVGWVVRHGATALIQDSSKDARYKVGRTGPASCHRGRQPHPGPFVPPADAGQCGTQYLARPRPHAQGDPGADECPRRLRRGHDLLAR